MKKDMIIRLSVGFFVHSVLYAIVGYFFGVSSLCFEDWSDVDCMKKTIFQILFFGFFMTIFDFFVLKKFRGRRVDKQ